MNTGNLERLSNSGCVLAMIWFPNAERDGRCSDRFPKKELTVYDGIGRWLTPRILSNFSDSIDLATEIPPKNALVTNATGPIAMNFPSFDVTIGSSSASAPSIIDVPKRKANTKEKHTKK